MTPDREWFLNELGSRNASQYATFFLPYVRSGMNLIDCGCGPGTITLGLAERLAPSEVVGFDLEPDRFKAAQAYAAERGISNLLFKAGDIYGLPFPDASFDAAFVHSVLEALQDPIKALEDVRRVLKPGGVVGVGSVDYGGVVISGPSIETLELFYRIREERWKQKGIGDPRMGRRLRGLLHEAGFSRIEASASYVSYGTPAAVQRFGENRAQECLDPEFADWAIKSGAADRTTLDAVTAGWRAWGRHPEAFFAFAWCNAIGWRE